MNDLVDFLLARIAEDKAKARAAKTPVEILDDIGLIYESSGHWLVGWNGDYWADDAVEALKGAVTDAARVLADCQAKLWIVVLHAPARTARAVAEEKDYMSCPVCDPFPSVDNPDPGPCETLRLLAAPYTDHPDHQGEWRLWNQQGEPTRHPGGATPV